MGYLMRIVLICLAALAAGAVAASASSLDEAGTYRFGGTYKWVSSTSPAVCSSLCGRDQQCKAWSQSVGRAGHQPRCELKRTPGRSEAHPGFVSGLSPNLLPGEPSRSAVAPASQPASAQGTRSAVRRMIAPAAASPQAPRPPRSTGLETNELSGQPEAGYSAPVPAAAPVRSGDGYYPGRERFSVNPDSVNSDSVQPEAVPVEGDGIRTVRGWPVGPAATGTRAGDYYPRRSSSSDRAPPPSINRPREPEVNE